MNFGDTFMSTDSLPEEKPPRYAIHTSYDSTNPPPTLSSKSIRFVCLSDTHSSTTFTIPPGDVLLHAGDLTDLGRLEEMERVSSWIYELPHPVKIIVGGNHDVGLIKI